MKLSKIRTIVAAVVFCVLAICLVAGINMGTLSGFGWDAFSALCPLGAFTTMLATKTIGAARCVQHHHHGVAGVRVRPRVLRLDLPGARA